MSDMEEKRVTISIIVLPGGPLKGDRPVSVAVGLAGSAPCIRTGIYAYLTGLIELAWSDHEDLLALASDTAVGEVLAVAPVEGEADQESFDYGDYDF